MSHEAAEWCESCPDGSVRYASEPVMGSGPEDVARAASAARERAGGVQTECVLAFAGKLIESRTLALPELARTDLARVLPRKAAALLELPVGECLYAALPFALERGDGSQASGERKWHLIALRRAWMTALRLALRRSGLRVERCVSAALSRLCAADELRGEREPACIVIDVERDGVLVSLISGEELRLQNHIRGSFESVPTMALSLIQELKSFDAFWRRVSRGSEIAQVVVLGLEHERARLFANALATALPAARVQLCPDGDTLAGPAGAPASRIASLRACAAEGAFLLDLAVPLPPRAAHVAAMVTCLAALTGAAGTVVHARMAGEARELAEQRCAIEGRCADLERLRSDNDALEQAERRARAEVERIAAAGSYGVPLETLLTEVLHATAGRGDVLTLIAERRDGPGRLELSGRTETDPVRAVRRLTAMERDLEQSPWVEGVLVEPPRLANSEAGGKVSSVLSFELHATLSGGVR